MKNIIYYITCLLLLTFTEAKSIEPQKLDSLIQVALKGNSNAQVEVVLHYYNNNKHDECLKWAKLLINNPDEKSRTDKGYAYRCLGLNAYYGKGMSQNKSQAIDYLRKSFECNKHYHAYSALLIGRILAFDSELQNDNDAIEWFTKAADASYAEACGYLDSIYEYGEYTDAAMKQIKKFPNVSKSYTKAAHYHEKYLSGSRLMSYAPEKDEPARHYKIAEWYYYGKGDLKIDYEKAFTYYKNAIRDMEQPQKCLESALLTNEQIANAMWNISVCYRFGRGTAQNELTAEVWKKKAAKMGHKKALGQ